MMEKRFWSGAIAVVTLIVAGAGALPELLLRPASTGPSVALPRNAPKAEPIAPPEQIAVVMQSASVPVVNRADTIAPPEPPKAEAAPQVVAAAPEPPKPEPEVPATPAPAPPVAFPPVQSVGVAAASDPGCDSAGGSSGHVSERGATHDQQARRARRSAAGKTQAERPASRLSDWRVPRLAPLSPETRPETDAWAARPHGLKSRRAHRNLHIGGQPRRAGGVRAAGNARSCSRASAPDDRGRSGARAGA